MPVPTCCGCCHPQLRWDAPLPATWDTERSASLGGQVALRYSEPDTQLGIIVGTGGLPDIWPLPAC